MCRSGVKYGYDCGMYGRHVRRSLSTKMVSKVDETNPFLNPDGSSSLYDNNSIAIILIV